MQFPPREMQNLREAYLVASTFDDGRNVLCMSVNIDKESPSCAVGLAEFNQQFGHRLAHGLRGLRASSGR